MENLKSLLQKLALTQEGLFAIATVDAVDDSGETLDATDILTEVPIYGVRLQAVADGSKLGVLVTPKIGSYVLVAALEKSFKDSFCAGFSEIEKIHVQIGTFKIEIDKDGVVANDGENGGLCIVPELKTQLAKLTARVDAVFAALTNSPTAPTDGGATYKTAITASLNTVVEKENFERIENPKIKH